ncbi:virulence factor TspB C-terminal domain-related protein [Acinetobacter baumannii]|uniref:virulence factor TspB C-terminal domain-related protein n=1 Tax=Acinetobacter baumannii TaxID=470 RepID=UPI00244CE288|nr:virulence factor TspB C-terminal domain-related protein [Acinetobacter baumannii]MDH2597664.1 virulence factor TspB C-terminal domain-related protein [Acinetobacter baumannii]
MVNRLCFRNLRIDNFKLITWLQIFIIAITPNFIFLQSANATTVAGEGWSVTKKLVQGATTFYDGTKNIVINGKNYAATGAAKITPAASQVSKMIVRTGAVLAVDLAIKALLGAVDYVMDPANSRVKYYVDPAGTQCLKNGTNCPGYYYLFFREPGTNGTYFSTVDPACSAVASYYGQTLVSIDKFYDAQGRVEGAMCRTKKASGSADQWSLSKIINPAYDPNAKPQKEEKYLPYDAVASQILNDAVADKAEGKAYVSSVADTALEDEERQIVPANDMVQQLNASQAIPTTGTGTGTAVPVPGTGTGTGDPTTAEPAPYDLKLNFPVFCDWAPVVCQAAQVAINFPGTVAGYWTTFNKWMNESASDTSETKPEVKELELNFDDGSRINFDQTCPQPQPIQVTFMGVTQDASFSFEPLCNFMIMIRPFVIGSAYLIGAYIVMGLSRGNSE